MPHAFERLWSALETQGEFETKIRDAVAQTTVVRHLSELGFQVLHNKMKEVVYYIRLTREDARGEDRVDVTTNASGRSYLHMEPVIYYVALGMLLPHNTCIYTKYQPCTRERLGRQA